MKVLFPAPLAPTNPMIPGSTSTVSPSSALTPGYRLVRSRALISGMRDGEAWATTTEDATLYASARGKGSLRYSPFLKLQLESHRATVAVAYHRVAIDGRSHATGHVHDVKVPRNGLSGDLDATGTRRNRVSIVRHLNADVPGRVTRDGDLHYTGRSVIRDEAAVPEAGESRREAVACRRGLGLCANVCGSEE